MVYRLILIVWGLANVGQTWEETNADGCQWTDRVAKNLGIKPQTIRYWGNRGVIEPTRFGEGRGNYARYDIRDTAAIAAVAELRRQGVSLQAVRKVQPKLREMGKTWTSARLLGFRRDRFTDVLIAESTRAGQGLLRSLLESPGQTVIADVALSDKTTEIRRKFEIALQLPAAKRGPKKGARRVAKVAHNNDSDTSPLVDKQRTAVM